MPRKQVVVFWTLWLVASSLGAALGGAASAEIARARIGQVGSEFAIGIARFALFGVLLDTPQWLVLRRYIPRAARWIPTTAAAIIAGPLAGLLPMFIPWSVLTSLNEFIMAHSRVRGRVGLCLT